MTRLRETAAGCAWLIEQWTHIADRLKYSHSILPSERAKAIRLLGAQVDDLDNDRVELFNLAYLGSLPFPDGGRADLTNAHNLFDGDRPESMRLDEFDDRLAHWVKIQPEREQGLEMLKSYAAWEIARLTTLRNALAAEKAELIEIEVGKAAADRTIEGGRALRYENSHKRAMLELMNQARSMRESRLAGVFQEVLEIGFSEELSAMMAEARRAAAAAAKPEPEPAGTEPVSEPAPAPADPVVPDEGAPAGPLGAAPEAELKADSELQSKPDSPPAEEPKSDLAPGVAADTSAIEKQIQEPIPAAPPASPPAPHPAPRAQGHGGPGSVPPRANPRPPHPWPRGQQAPFRPPDPGPPAREPAPEPAPPPSGGDFNPRDG